MELLPILRLFWERLSSQKTIKEVKAFSLIAILFMGAVAFRPYEETSDRIDRDSLSLSDRLGYAILLKAGYGEAEAETRSIKTEDSESSKEVQTGRWNFKTTYYDHADFNCKGYDENFGIVITSTGELLNIEKLTVAIVAAEKYNRNSFQRWLEIKLARTSLKHFSKLPEFSYGLAQIKPKIIRKVLERELGENSVSDNYILEMNTENCQSVRIAGQYIYNRSQYLASTHEASISEIIEKVALDYNGSTLDTIQGLRYVDAVKGAYYLLVKDDSYLPLEDPYDYNQLLIGCINFKSIKTIPEEEIKWLLYGHKHRREIIEIDNNDLKQFIKPKNKVNIYLKEAEIKSSTYRSLLDEQRKQWMINELVKLGLTQNDITVTQLDQYSRKLSPYTRNFVTQRCPRVNGIISISRSKAQTAQTCQISTEQLIFLTSGPSNYYQKIKEIPGEQTLLLLNGSYYNGYWWLRVKYNDLVGWVRSDWVCG